MSQSTESEPTESETPMIAVYLAIGAIVVAGLYGLYLGTHAGAKGKTAPTVEGQSLLNPPHVKHQGFARRSA